MTKSTKRNVSIDLTTAKEWYKQGGDLRKVALQAFDEQELRTPEYGDIIEYNGMKGYIVGFDDDGNPNAFLSVDFWKENWNDAMKREFSGGWHLPNLNELEEHRDGIKAIHDKYDITGSLWSSLEYDYLYYAWSVHLYYGDTYCSSKDSEYVVRAFCRL